MNDQLVVGLDGKKRCRWCEAAPDFLIYHDNEWGYPVNDDYRLFEKLTLESFQSGLSWRTILSKRENFRSAFHHFDFDQIARFTQRDITRLLKDEGIVRHRGKIEAAINNVKLRSQIIPQPSEDSTDGDVKETEAMACTGFANNICPGRSRTSMCFTAL